MISAIIRRPLRGHQACESKGLVHQSSNPPIHQSSNPPILVAPPPIPPSPGPNFAKHLVRREGSLDTESAKTCRKIAFQAQIRNMYHQIPPILQSWLPLPPFPPPQAQISSKIWSGGKVLWTQNLQKPVVKSHSKPKFEVCIFKFLQF